MSRPEVPTPAELRELARTSDTTTTGELVARRTLAENEAVIERGLGTFVEVGEALMEIRDARQYRATHGDFDTYCRERWGMAKRTANQLIDAHGVVGAIAPTGAPVPATESQARALAPLRDDPEAADVARSVGEISPTATPSRESHAAALAPLRDDPEAMGQLAPIGVTPPATEAIERGR